MVRFHRTGEASGNGRVAETQPGLRSVLLSPYRDLSQLRYDFPLVLVEGGAEGDFVRPLSGVVGSVLQEVAAPGIAGERLRKDVLRLETAIRNLAADGAEGTLSGLWELAERQLLSGSDEAAGEGPGLARAALQVDGQVIDCDEDVATRLLEHAWRAVHEQCRRGGQEVIDALILKLSDILKADFLRSEEGRAPEKLRASVGSRYAEVFDFEAMSDLLQQATPESTLPESRLQRIRSVLSTLESQRFFGRGGDAAEEADGGWPHAFVFESCTRALETFRERLPEMLELIKAISIAELEVENRYREAKHDGFFERFDESTLVPADLEFFPSYLVCLRDKDCDARERADLFEVLSSGLPVKVLVEASDILGDPSLGDGRFSFAVKSLQLASSAVGLGSAYVLQSASSNLYQLRDRIFQGLTRQGPTLFSVFSGSAENAPELPPYLTAATAMWSRAFPAFTYDPAAGDDWASRFSIEDNPEAEADWPVQRFSYGDEDLQKVSEDVACTFVDFAAADRRYAGHFARVPRSSWNAGMVPASAYLEREVETNDEVPYILMVDEEDSLHRILVDDKLIRAARHCTRIWRSLQELGGIHNSHARRLLEREREVWEQEKERELEELRSQLARAAGEPAGEQGNGAAQPAAAQQAVARETAAEEAPEAQPLSPDEPSIDTSRCTTCDECTDKNPNMFKYDEDKQACRGLPGVHHPPGQAEESGRVGPGGADRAGRSFQLAALIEESAILLEPQLEGFPWWT